MKAANSSGVLENPSNPTFLNFAWTSGLSMMLRRDSCAASPSSVANDPQLTRPDRFPQCSGLRQHRGVLSSGAQERGQQRLVWRFRTIQVCPKDSLAILRQLESVVD
jgi:hypothetical protein